ncbi:MAG: HYR domain-containing protein, partial [Saprospiraceae bacterium]|nr:HYR domain-containing protein [Saprospiraceae bacterium]
VTVSGNFTMSGWTGAGNFSSGNITSSTGSFTVSNWAAGTMTTGYINLTVGSISFSNWTVVKNITTGGFGIGGNFTVSNCVAGWTFLTQSNHCSLGGNFLIDNAAITFNQTHNLSVGGNFSILNGATVYNHGNVLTVSKSFTLNAAMTFNQTNYVIFNTSTAGQTITSTGKQFTNVRFNGSGGEWILQDNFKATGTTEHYTGIFRSNAKTVDYGQYFNARDNGTVKTLDYTGTDTVRVQYWFLVNTNVNTILTMGGAVLLLHTVNNVEMFIDGGGKTFGTVVINHLHNNTTSPTNIRFRNDNSVYGNVFITINNGSRLYKENTNNTFGNISINYINAAVTVTDWNYLFGTNTFGNFTITSNGLNPMFYCGQNNTFGQVSLAAGTTWQIANSKVQTLTGLTAIGNCLKFIRIYATSTTASINDSNGGANALDFVRLSGITFGGAGAAWTATNVLDDGGNTGITITPLAPQTYYWIGGAGNWNDINRWSLSSGGSSSGCIPTDVDHVVFDNNSFTGSDQTVTLNVAATITNMSWTSGVTGGPNFNGSQALILNGDLNVAGTMDWNLSGAVTLRKSLTLNAGMTWNQTGNFSFSGTTAGNTINLAGKTFGTNVYFDNPGNSATGAWTLAADFTVAQTKFVSFTDATFISAGFKVDFGDYFDATPNVVKVFDFTGTDTVRVKRQWQMLNNTNATLTMGTAVLLLRQPAAEGNHMYLDGGGKTYHDVVFDARQTNGTYTQYIRNNSMTFRDVYFNISGAQHVSIEGSGYVFRDVYANYGSSTTSYAPNFELFNNHTLTNLQFTNPSVQPKLYLRGSNTINTLALYHGMDVFFGHNQTQTLQSVTATSLCTRLIDLASTQAGTQATLTDAAGTNALDYVSLKDLKAQGGATWNASNVINNGNNTGWNITSAPSVTYYWIGGTGNWNDGAHWALSSGGTAAGCSPNPQDDVVFDNNSFTATGQTVNLVGSTKCRNMTWTAGVTQNPTFQGNFEMDIEGDLNVLGTMTWIQNSTLYPRGDFKLNANVTWQHNQVLYFFSDSTNNILNTAGKSIIHNARFDAKTSASGPKWTLGSDFNITNSGAELRVLEGTWISDGYEINAGYQFRAHDGTDVRHIDLTGTDTIRVRQGWYMSTNVNTTLTLGGATILLQTTANENQQFYGGNRVYKDVVVSHGSSNDGRYMQFLDNNIFEDIFVSFPTIGHQAVYFDNQQNVQTLRVDRYTNWNLEMYYRNGPHTFGSIDINVLGNGPSYHYFQNNAHQLGNYDVLQGNGNANFYFQSANNQFQDVVVTTSGTGTAYLEMQQNASFAKLDLPNGFDMLVYAGRTQTIGNFIPRSTCLRRSKIRGQNATTSVISQASGTVSTEWITLENHTVQGGAIFNATDVTQVGTINGWNAGFVQPITLFWVGGTGNWSDANKWALVSGGPGNGCLIPSAVDNAVFDANSFTAASQSVSLDVIGACKNMIWNNVAFNPTFQETNANTRHLTVVGDLVINSPMTWNWPYTGRNNTLYLRGSATVASSVTWNHLKEVQFEPVSGSHTINMGGKTFQNNVRFNGAVGSKWTLLNNFTVNSGYGTYLTQGEFYSNGFAVDFGLLFDFNNTNTKKIDLTGTTTAKVRRDWLGNGTGTTFVSGGATILLESSAGENQTFTGGNITTYGDLTVRHLEANNRTITFNGNNTFGEVNFEYTNRKDLVINGNNTFGGFTVTQDYGVTSNIPQHAFNGSNSFGTFVVLSLGVQGPEIAFAQNNTFGNLISAGRGTRLKFGNAKTQTITGEILILGTGGQPIFFNSTTAGAQATISKASGNVCLDFVWIKDINATGGATFNAGVNGANLGNNTGINFGSACAAYYWVGGSGNWTDLNHWATSSGGSTLHLQLPTEIDDVYFDANSFTATGQTVTFDDPNAECRNMNWFSSLYQPTLAGSASDIDIYGSLTLTPFMTQNWNGIWNFVAQSGLFTMDTKGKTLQDMNINTLTGAAQISLLNDLKVNNDLTLTKGTFNTDGHNVETKNFNVVGTADRTLELGASQLTVTNGKWDVQDVTNLSITPGTSKIVVQSEGATSHFYGGGKTYYDLRIRTNTTMSSTLTGSNTFNQLKVDPGVTLSIEAGSTQTATDPVISGTCNKSLTIQSTVSGTQANLSKASGTVNASFLSLKDINATGGATFNASQATDNGNNSGWNFISVPALLVSVNVTDATCPTPNNGTAAAVVTGGVTPFAYLWNTIATTQTLNNLSQGTYTVTVTDGAGCVASATGTVGQPASYGFASTTTGDLICFGASDGEASVSAPGGQTPLIYLWSNNATTATLTGLGIGTYTVTITDGNNCKATNTATVTQRPDINAAISVNSPPCINTDMNLGGSGTGVNLMFDWDFPTLGQTAGGQTTTVNFPAANTHTVQLTVTDENACSDVTTVAIVINTALALNGTITNASDCTGSCDGAVVLAASGGQAPYQFAGTAFDYDFTGTTLNASLFEKDNIKTYTQNGDLTVSGGTNAWTAYLNTTGTFSRVVGSEFTFSYYNATSTLGMIGWHGNSTGNANRYFDLIYAFYFNNATLNIYEDGTSRGTFTAQVPGGFSTNTWYEGKIILKSSGADYYLRKQGQPTYTLIYASSFSTETALRLGMTIHTSAVGNPVKTDDWFVYGANPFTTGLCPGDYTYTATDANGCTDSYTATVGANDPNPPTASCKNHTVSLNALSSYTLTAADINDNSSDDCGSVILAVNASVFTCSDIGANTVQLTVTDNNNNTSTCTATITVQAAEIDVQGNSTSIADGDNMPAATDHTDFGQYSGTPITRTFTIFNSGSSDLTLGANAISITGADAGLFAAANVTLPAVVSGPNGSLTFDVIYTPVAIGIHTATVEIASDECNEAAYNFAIQGELSCTPPTFTACPAAPVTANTATGQCTAAVSYTVTAGGTPTPALTYAFTGATTGSGNGTGSGETFNKGNTTVTVTATNACGAPTCSFTVTVTDNEKPTISCAGPVTVNTTPGLCTGTTTLTAPTVTDNCSLILGNALGFDGANDFVQTNTPFSPGTTDYTIETWVYNRSSSGYIWARDNSGDTNHQFRFRFTGAGQVEFAMSEASQNNPMFLNSTTNAIPVNAWTHVACVRQGTNHYIYINGVLNASMTTGSVVNCTPSYPFHIAKRNNGEFFNGVLDEFRIWTVARTPSEIQSAMNLELIGNEAGLNTYYKFNQGIAEGNNAGLTTVTATAGPNATLFNSSLSGTTSNWVGGAFRVPTNDAPTTYPIGNTTVTWTATDASGNTETCQQTVTVTDNQMPTITCPSGSPFARNTDATECNYTVQGTEFDPTAFGDNCPGATISNSFNSMATLAGADLPKGSTTITWTVTDGMAMSSTTCAIVVTVSDNQPPTITCAGPVSINTTSGQCTGTTTLVPPTASDNCISLGNALHFDGADDFVNIGNPAINGLSTLSFETWVKFGALTNDALLFTKGGTSNEDVQFSLGGPNYGGDINNLVVTIGENPGTGLAFARTTSSLMTAGTWYHVAFVFNGAGATNADRMKIYVNGNPQTLTFSGTIPTTTPMTTVNALLGCRALGVRHMNGTLDEVRLWTSARSQTQIQGAMNTELVGNESGLLSYYKLNQGVAGGNNAGITTATATTGANGTLSGFALNGATSNWVQGTVPSSPITVTSNAPSTYPIGNTTVTWTATDASGNTETCQQTVTVVDNQAPTLTCPSGSPFARNTDATECNYTVQGTEFNPTAFGDNCPGATVSNSFNNMASLAGADLPKGSTTITWTVTDGMAMSSTTCAIVVTVSDNQMPTITCPSGSPFARNTDATECNYTVQGTEFDPTAFGDNCPGATVTNSFNNMASLAGADLPKGSTTITWTVTDGMAMSSTTCAIVVNVTDNQMPTITCPSGSPFARNTDATECNYTVQGTEFNPTAFGDNCPGATISNSFNGMATLANADLPKGSNTITWTVTDGMGMSSTTCAIVVTVSDNQAPTVTNTTGDGFADIADYTCNTATITISSDPFTCVAFRSIAKPLWADNCDATLTLTRGAVWLPSTPLSLSNAAQSVSANFPAGTTVITFTAKDGSNNIATCSLTITVEDNQPPVLTSCPTHPQPPVNSPSNTCSAVVNWAPPVASDNCLGVSMSVSAFSPANSMTPYGGSALPGSNFPVGTYTIVYKATDAMGLTTTCSFNIEVKDVTAPVVTCPAATATINTNAGTSCEITIPDYVMSLSATDNCSAVTEAQSIPAGVYTTGVSDGATVTVNYTATDGAAPANTTTCTVVITVNDDVAPTVACPAATAVINTNAGTSCEITIPDYV